MGPYGLICSCPFGYNAFFSSLNLIFYLFCEKFLRNCVKDNEKKKKNRLQSSYINIPPLQHVHAGPKMELTAAEVSFLVLF